jgi:hypothetical protein
VNVSYAGAQKRAFLENGWVTLTGECSMLKHPADKYRPFIPVTLPDRRWPQQQIAGLQTGLAALI